MFIAPVREHQHVVSLVAKGFWFERIDDQRTIHATLFLKSRMTVVPVGSSLADCEPIDMRLTRRDAVETESRHAVHVGRHEDSVPVDRGVFCEGVLDTHDDGIALSPTKCRGRDGTVHGNGESW